MQEAVIVDAVRTPGGRRNGQLSGWHPASLAAHVLKALMEDAAREDTAFEWEMFLDRSPCPAMEYHEEPEEPDLPNRPLPPQFSTMEGALPFLKKKKKRF